MSDDTSVPDSEQPSTALLSRLVELNASEFPSVSTPAERALRLLGPATAREVVSLRRENEALRAQVAAHEDADRRWSADMEALRETLSAATPRLEAYGAIAHVAVGYDDGPVDAVIAACTELPFVRIENKRLRNELAELRRELQAERDFRAQMIADIDARSGEPL